MCNATSLIFRRGVTTIEVSDTHQQRQRLFELEETDADFEGAYIGCPSIEENALRRLLRSAKAKNHEIDQDLIAWATRELNVSRLHTSLLPSHASAYPIDLYRNFHRRCWATYILTACRWRLRNR